MKLMAYYSKNKTFLNMEPRMFLTVRKKHLTVFLV